MNGTYTLTEGNDALNRVLLMMQYELGKTLDEQKIPTDKDLKKYQQGEYENATRKYVDNTATTFRGPDGRQKTTATSPKITKDLNIKKLTFDEFMEQYRENLFSIPGMAIEAFLTATEFGAVPVVAAWGFLLWYDVKKGIDTGNWVWENLIIDVLMVASAGLLGFGLKAIATSGKLAGKGLSEIIQTLIKTKGGEKIVEFLRILSTKSGEIIKSIKPGLEWFSKSIVAQGAKWLSKGTLNVIKKMLQGVGFVISKVGVLIEKMSLIIEKQLNKVGVTGKLGKGLGAAGGITSFNLGLIYSAEAIKTIHDKWVQMGIDANNKITISQHIIEANPSIYGKDVIFKNFSDKKDLDIYKKSSKGIYSVYVNKSKKWIEIEPDDEYNEQVEALFISNIMLNKINLKFDEFEILNMDKKIYKINNKKYQAFGDDYKLKEIK
jgi:hypothetical protein